MLPFPTGKLVIQCPENLIIRLNLKFKGGGREVAQCIKALLNEYEGQRSNSQHPPKCQADLTATCNPNSRRKEMGP